MNFRDNLLCIVYCGKSFCLWYLWLLIWDMKDITAIKRDIMSDQVFNRVIKVGILTLLPFFFSIIYTPVFLSE